MPKDALSSSSADGASNLKDASSSSSDDATGNLKDKDASPLNSTDAPGDLDKESRAILPPHPPSSSEAKNTSPRNHDVRLLKAEKKPFGSGSSSAFTVVVPRNK